MSQVAPDEYEALVRGLLQTARNRAYQAVDNIKVQAYWQVGERIVRAELEQRDRADYGTLYGAESLPGTADVGTGAMVSSPHSV